MQVNASRLLLLDLCCFENGGAAAKSGRARNHLHGGFTPPFAVAYLSATARRISQGEAMPSPATRLASKAELAEIFGYRQHIGSNSPMNNKV